MYSTVCSKLEISSTFSDINQSINQTSIAPISPAKPCSVAWQPNQCSIIKTTGHESSSKQFCTIQIKATMNAPQIPHIVKAWVTDYKNMWAEGEIFIKYEVKKCSERTNQCGLSGSQTVILFLYIFYQKKFYCMKFHLWSWSMHRLANWLL